MAAVTGDAMKDSGKGTGEPAGALGWERVGGRLVVVGPGGVPLLEEAKEGGISPLSVAEARLRWFQVLSWWRFFRKVGPWRGTGTAAESNPGGRTVLADRSGAPLVEVMEGALSEGTLRGEIRVAEEARGDWLRWRIKAEPGERFLGFGERFNAVDQRGNKLFVWTEEGAIGLGERWGRMLDGVSWNPFPNGPTTAYKPMPFFISSRGYGLLLETAARVEYDVAATDPGVVDIIVWDRAFSWVLFYGPEPSKVVERFTERVGRASVPAPWVFAPWNDAVYGQENVLAQTKKLREEKIPTTAIWTEDWQGGYWMPPIRKRRSSYLIFPCRYDIARHLYPDAEDVASDLHDRGFRWLSYFFPYILRHSREYREAKEKGYLLKNRRGGVNLVMMLWHPYGHIDLTNPEAKKWYMDLLEKNVEAGFDGWMADFSEYVPPGSVTSTGESGLVHHNRFPLLWQQMNRELFDRLRPDGDFVFFCRAAAVGAQKYAPVFWSGDSNTDFEKYDGLPSNLPAVLSSGLSGLPFWAADIGGYASLMTRGRDRELYYRWVEFAALLSVMRTHHGTHPGRSWQWDTDADTVRLFGDYARLHTALFPYIYSLAHEAAATGLPAVRHLVLHYPADPRAWAVEDQFLLGDRILVAPVIERNARGRAVYFPVGTWVDYWSGESIVGPAERHVRAPLELLPLFVAGGKVVPTLDLPVDTLAPVARDSGLVGIDEATDTIRFTLYGEGEDRVVLPDGTVAEMWRARGTDVDALGRGLVDAPVGSIRAERAPDRLQPSHMRAAAHLVVSASGESIDILVSSPSGTRLAGAAVKGGPAREAVTFEWR